MNLNLNCHFLSHTHTHTHSLSHTHTLTHSLSHTHTLTHSLSHTLTHTHVCFCELWGYLGVMVFILYKLYFLFSVFLNLPLTGNFVHFYFLKKKKTHSVLFINLLKNGDMGKCPHKSPSPCNTCHTHVFIQICVLICHKNKHTHTHRS